MQFKNQLFPITAQNCLLLDPPCSESQHWGENPMAYNDGDQLKTDIPSPGVPGAL